MTKQVLVVGHSDADGHVIAEQTRRNLALVPSFQVDVVVDPKRTSGHRSWCHLDAIPEIKSAELVIFVDLMFSPATFIPEARALVDTVRANPSTLFIVIDHHPLPLGRLAGLDNLRVCYRPDVFECTIGPKSGLMILAAIFEHQGQTIGSIRQPIHRLLEKGLRRASAVGSPLAGDALMALLAHDRWDIVYELAEEDSAVHKSVRGRRIANQPPSKALNKAEKLALELREGAVNHVAENLRDQEGGRLMPYDIAVERYALESREPNRYRNSPVPAKDLEALVTLLEVAALSLTTAPDATFTRDELLKEARDLGGDELEIDEQDARIVLEKASFIEWTGGRLKVR